MTEIFVGRQPIYNRQRQVVAYELLYRPSAVNAANVIDGDRATAQVMLHTLTDIGLDRLVGHRTAFVNITRNTFFGNTLQLLPRERVVLEVLEDTVVDAPLLEALRVLHANGYRLALDDFILTEATRSLLPLAEIVKIDLLATPLEELEALVPQFRRHGLKLLAEKVETVEQYEGCRALGFDFFQGYLFSRPHVVSARQPPAAQASLLALIARLNNPRVALSELERLIQRDTALSYRLLRYLNSAYFNLPHRVESIHRAVVLLGLDNTRAWATLLVLVGGGDNSGQLAATALVRASLCQRLAEHQGLALTDSAFIVGLLSTLEALLATPMAQILADLPLSEPITEALLRQEGPLGPLLAGALAYERQDWVAVAAILPLPTEVIREAYLQALVETEEVMNYLP